VEIMGGADRVVAAAGEAFARGEYRWVAQLVDHVVFAEPGHAGARSLQAAALEQLGYQTENATWRNFYLMGARELRDGVAPLPPMVPRTASALTLDQVFDVLGVRLNGPELADRRLVSSWDFTDTGEQFVVSVEHGALNATRGRLDPEADVVVRMARSVLDRVLVGELALVDAVGVGDVVLEGDVGALAELFGSLEISTPDFPIVTP
jgi:alkyl sulfatase BDS1-like metallo-beta-lactamase superfamily hydrolase